MHVMLQAMQKAEYPSTYLGKVAIYCGGHLLVGQVGVHVGYEAVHLLLHKFRDLHPEA